MLTLIDCFSRFAFAKIFKNKSGDEVKNAFQSIFNESNRIPKKIQTDQGTEFYNVQVKKLFNDNNIIHFSVYSDVKACMVERFNRILKSKMWKVFTERKNHKYIDILDDLVNNYNNSLHNTIKMTPFEASKKENTLKVDRILNPIITFGHDSVITKKEIIPKFKVGDKVRISKKLK